MDTTVLPPDCKLRIAALLLDERDLCALAAVSHSWREVLQHDSVWRQVLLTRFGAAAAAALPPPPPPGEQNAAEEQAPSPAKAEFRKLSRLERPVARLDKIVWLDGNHLQEVTEPGSESEVSIKVHNVCWLELGGSIPGVPPGRYRVAWRMRLQGHFFLDHAQLTVQPEGASEVHTGIEWQGMQHIFHQVGSEWFDLLGHPFEVRSLGSVKLQLLATSGAWKHGVVFDRVRLLRQAEDPPSGSASSSRTQGGGLLQQGWSRLQGALQGALGRSG